MAPGTSRLSLILDPKLLDATKALVASRAENPHVPWTTLTEVVTWGLQQAPEEVERRRQASMYEASMRALQGNGPARTTELPFRVYYPAETDARFPVESARSVRRRGVWGPGMALPESSETLLQEITVGRFHREGLVNLECPAEGITRFLGVRVEAASGEPIEIAVQDLRDREPLPEPTKGKVTLVYLDVGGSPNVLSRDKTTADILCCGPVLPSGSPSLQGRALSEARLRNQALADAMLHPPVGTTYALMAYPILIPPNEARLDLVVHPDDGPLRVFLIVDRLR